MAGAGPRIEGAYRELAGVVGWLCLVVSAKQGVRPQKVREQIEKLDRAKAELELLLPADALTEDE
jgi:hypothetical protein